MDLDYFAIYKDIWAFHKKQSQRIHEPDFWQRCVADERGLSKKYGHATFVVNLLFGEIEEFRRIRGEAVS